MKIIFIIDSLSSGGAQRQITLLANMLCNTYEIQILYYSGNDHFRKSVCKRVNVIKFINKYELMRYLLSDMLTNDKKIYYSYLNTPNIILGISSMITNNNKVIISERGEQYLDSKIRKILMRIIALKVKYIVVNSQYLEKKMKSHLRSKKVIYIPNIIDIKNVNDDFPNEKDDKIRIGIIGRFAEEKNQISVFDLIDSLRENTEILFIGDTSNSYYSRFLIKLETISYKNKVKVLDRTIDIDHIYNILNFVIIPSKRESFPNVLIESYLFGRPVISAYVGENIKILKNNNFGYLYKNKTEFSIKFKSMINKSKQEIAEMGKLGRQYIVDNYYGVNEKMNRKIIDEFFKNE